MRLPNLAQPILRNVSTAAFLQGQNGITASGTTCVTCPKGKKCVYCLIGVSSYGCDNNGEPYVNCILG